MTIDQLLQAGITAVRAGDLDAASRLFAQVVKADPNSEQGWLWLGKCVPDPKQREYCFKRVLALNPNNAEAREELGGPFAAAPMPANKPPVSNQPPAYKPPLPTHPSIAPQPPAEQPKPRSPFVVDNVDTFPEETPPAWAQQDLPPLPTTPVRPEKQETPAPEKKQGARNRKKTNPLLVFILVMCALIFLVCLGGGGYLYLSGQWVNFLPASLAPITGPTTTTGPAPLLPTETITLPPSPTVSPTIAAPTATPTALPTVAYTPTFKEEKCKFDPPADVTVKCGSLSVPEDRTDPDSPKIQIAVAVFHSTSDNPAPDPVIFLQGGPGGEAIMTSAGAYSILVKPFLDKRDYIAFDQRGTGLSKPALGCEELETVYKQDIHGQIPASSRNMIYTNAFRSCHGMMAIGGTDLNAFNTEASADDLKDLVTVLGYSQVNLYGASYGTRLALVTMRSHAEILKSVVLDSVVPVEAKLYYDDPQRYASSLQAMFDGCAADPKCFTAYPNLETDFWNMIDQLDTQPVSVTAPLLTGGKITESVTGSDLLGITLALLKTTRLIGAAPMALNQIKAGDYSTFVAMQSSLPYEFEGIDIGLYISVMCHEHILSGTQEELQAVIDTQHDIGQYSRLPFFGNAKDMFNTCKVWGSTPPTGTEKAPVVSDIPTLIIEGAYDPATPPLYGKQVAQNLSHSYYLEFPNQGHVPLAGDSTGCASGIIREFFDDPGRDPDRACMANLPKIDFVTPYTGDPPVKLEVQTMGSLTAKMPVDWSWYGNGFYRRDNSPLDITQIAVMRAYFADSSTVLDSLSSKLYGYEGFDSAPLMVGTRKANGLNWSLYQTTSYGRPVELAMADSPHGDALIVLLFCHKDELDALYQTVYLPIIDSVVPGQ